MSDIIEAWWRDFEEMGEEAVRQRLSTNVWRASRKKAAKEWLRKKEQERTALSHSENLALHTRATKASEIQASEATEANRLSREAILLSRVAIGLSLLALLVAGLTLIVELSKP